VALPGSFTGGPKWYQTCFLDAMNMVNNIGPSTLIGTMTCNPNWPEVKTLLKPNEQPMDRIDILCRVFKMKLNMLLDDIFKNMYLDLLLEKFMSLNFQNMVYHMHIF